MPINPSLAKKYAEFRGITEQDLADAYGDDEKQLEADLQSEGLTAADFDEPSVGVQPAAPEPPSEGEVVRRLVNYGRKGQKEAALANEEIDRRFMAAKERGEDYAGVDEYVRKNLGGSKRRSALDRLVSGMSNVRRTVTAPLEHATTALAAAVLKPEEVFDTRAPVLSQDVVENISSRVQANQFSEIDAAARKADRQKTELEQALAESQMGQQAGDATATQRTGYVAPEPGFAQSLVDVAKEAATNPREFAIRTAGELTTPANIATEAAAPFVGLGAGMAGRTVANAARRTRLGRAVGMDPLAMTGAIRRPSLTKMVAGEGMQAAGSELLETGDVTAAGTAAGIAPAVAGTVVRKALAPRPRAEGAAARPDAQPVAEPPTVAPEPPAVEAPPSEAMATEAPTAPQPAAVAPEPVAEVKPLPTRNSRPRNTEETRAAKEIARKDAMRAKADAESKINNHTKKATTYAKQGDVEFAEKLLDNSRADYDILWGDLAEQVFAKDKELLRKEAQAAASKRQPKLRPPKTIKEAEAQVQQAVEAGTPEAIEAARPAIEALHPVAEDAAKVVDDLKVETTKPMAPRPYLAPETPTMSKFLEEANKGRNVNTNRKTAEEVRAIASGVRSIKDLNDKIRSSGASIADVDSIYGAYVDERIAAGYEGGPYPDSHGKSIRDFADEVRGRLKDDAEVKIIDKLIPALPDGFFFSYPETKSGLARGMFAPNGSRSVVEIYGRVNNQTALHELVHAALVGRLSKSAESEIDSLMQNRELLLATAKSNAYVNRDEFIAYAMTDYAFQKDMMTVRVGDETVWSKFVKAIRSALGIADKYESAFDRIVRVFDDETSRLSKPAQVAPEPKKKKPKVSVEPKEDPTVRPVINIGKDRQELSSVSDRASDPIEANAGDHAALSDRQVAADLRKLGRHKLASDLEAVVSAFDSRVATEIESANGPVYIGALADEMSMEFREDLASAISDPTNVLIDDFAESRGVSRQDLVDAFQAAQYTKEERKVISKVIAELRETEMKELAPEQKARQLADAAELDARTAEAIASGEEVALYNPEFSMSSLDGERNIVRLGSMGGALPLEKIPEQIGAVAKFVDDNVLFHGQRISDEFTELTNEAMKRGGPQAAETLNDLLLETRRIDNASDRRISSFFAKINAELRKIPEVGIGIRGLDIISDALDGRKVELNEWQQRIHDVIREALDDLGADYERITGNPMRKGYFPRVEEKALIRKATASFKKQYESAGAVADLTDGPMTFKKAAGLKNKIREINDPLAAEAIRNQTEVLKSLFEKDKDGNIALKLDETGKPLINREAAYLLMIPEDGELPPMLPDLFANVGTKIDEELNGEPVYGPPYSALFKTGIKYPEGEALDDLLNAESMRLFANREDYDPDSKSRNFHATSGRWQMDGSLTNARMMPNLGDRFYDRNPINVIAHIIPRQVRGLQRQETFGLKKEKLLSKLQSLDGAFSPQELGIVREGEGYRLATKKDGAAYDRSLLRSIEDVAMGYVRPFTEEKWCHRLFDGAGKIARYAVLTGKLINTAANEIAQAGAAAAYSPAVGTAYAAARARVAKAQMESGGRRVLESGVRSAALPLRALEAAGSVRTAKLGRDLQKAALKRLVDGDPIVQADIRAMSDASTMVGATAAERALNGIQNLVGSFAASNKAADIASHYAGFSMFNDLIARRTEDPAGFKREAGLLEDDLRRTVSEKDMDEAASLLDSAGWPKDANAAERILQLAGPFISEMKSKMSGRSSPLFQPKFARQRWARSAMWLAMIPFSIASGQLAGIRRAFKAGSKIEGAKRIAKLGAVSAGVGYLTLLAKANPQMAAAVGATVTGQFPALAAATSIAGEFDPNETPGEAALAALESDWTRGDDVQEQIYNKALTLAGLAAKGFSWKPRMMEPDMLTKAEASLAGQRKFTPRMAETLAQMALPGTMALAQTGAQMWNDASLMSTGSALPLTMGLFMPSVREAMGNTRINLQAQKQFNTKIDPETINEKSQPLSEAGAADLIKAGINMRMKKLPRN